jgi:hypothetical protein
VRYNQYFSAFEDRVTTLTTPHVDRWKIRSLIAVTAVVGVLGLPVALLFGEPYPWIMMPGFMSAGGFDGERVERATAAFIFRFADGTSATVDPPAMFGTVPGSNYYTLAARFSPHQVRGARLEHIPAALFPNLHGAARSGVPDAADPQLRTWLREQAERLFPGRQPDILEVQWRRVSIDAHGTRRTLESRTSVRFEL